MAAHGTISVATANRSSAFSNPSRAIDLLKSVPRPAGLEPTRLAISTASWLSRTRRSTECQAGDRVVARWRLAGNSGEEGRQHWLPDPVLRASRRATNPGFLFGKPRESVTRTVRVLRRNSYSFQNDGRTLESSARPLSP
jgi:hypothetical protein